MEKPQTNKRKAFTLLEMLIVVFIIGFLATLTLISFNSIRKTAQLNLAIDSVNNIFNSTRNGARYGKEEIENKSSCWGLWIKKDESRQTQIRQFTSKYNKGNDSCEIEKEPTEFKNNNLFKEEKIELKSITKKEGNKETETEELVIMFKPPKAEIEIYNGFRNGEQKQTKIKSIHLSFGFENNEEKENWKTLKFNAFSGEVKEIKKK